MEKKKEVIPEINTNKVASGELVPLDYSIDSMVKISDDLFVVPSHLKRGGFSVRKWRKNKFTLVQS